MRTIKFTEEQLKNLSIFLDRVPMTGKIEAAAMTDICTAMNQDLIEMLNADIKQPLASPDCHQNCAESDLRTEMIPSINKQETTPNINENGKSN